MLKKLILALFIAAFPSLALAQTFAPDFPILSGASYCFSTVNGVCTRTIPAGPALTGAETIPADTNIGNSGLQSGKISIASLGGGLQNEVPLTGASLTLNQPGVGKLFINPAGTIAALTITLPASTLLIDGQTLYINSSQIVTTLTLTAGSGTTLGTATTSLAVNTPIRYVYMKATAVWVKG